MLALYVLGLLMGTPLHGYEIRKQLSELLGYSTAVSFGSLYPTLAKLHSQGLVETSNAPISYKRKPIFSTGSLTGDLAYGSKMSTRNPLLKTRKNKKVYAITEKGVSTFKEKLLSSYANHADDDRAFVAHLAFLNYSQDDEKEIFISNRISALTQRLNTMKKSTNNTLIQWNDVQRDFINHQITFLTHIRDNESTHIS